MNVALQVSLAVPAGRKRNNKSGMIQWSKRIPLSVRREVGFVYL